MTAVIVAVCVLAYLGAGVGTAAIGIRRGWDMEWLAETEEMGVAQVVLLWPIPWVAIGITQSVGGFRFLMQRLTKAVRPKPAQLTPVEDDPDWEGHDWTPPPDAIRGAS